MEFIRRLISRFNIYTIEREQPSEHSTVKMHKQNFSRKIALIISAAAAAEYLVIMRYQKIIRLIVDYIRRRKQLHYYLVQPSMKSKLRVLGTRIY